MTNSGVSAPAHNRVALAAVAVGALLIAFFQYRLLASHHLVLGDFHAFYCGGKAILAHADPYVAASLRACEALAQPYGLHSSASHVVTPVPYPGYVFALFAPFGALPYLPSVLLWLVVTVACTVYSAYAISRLTNLPLWVCAAVLTVAYTVVILEVGEVAPIALAAMCAAALFLRDGRYWAGAIALGVAAILPHVLLPALIAVFIGVSRARLPLLVCGAILIGLDVAAGGAAQALEYFTRVLPAHAQSEIGFVWQYGLTWVLHGAGLNDAVTLRSADVAFAFACVLGVAAGIALMRKTRDLAFLIFVPAAFAVAISPFMHYSEITLVFPAAMLLYSRSGRSLLPAAAACIMLLAVPWQTIVVEPAVALPASMAAVIVLSAALFRADRAMLYCTGAAILYGVALLGVAVHAGPQVQTLNAAPIAGDLAQSAWAHYIRSQVASAGIVWWIAKIPTWLGLIGLAACSAYAASKEDFVSLRVVHRPPIRS